MKDVKVYDGSGWQSIKGSPGPSEPSKVAGNILTKGSDGLLYAPSIVESGNWTPEGFWPEGQEQFSTSSVSGVYVKVGPLVHVAGVLQTNADNISTLPLAIGGLPYPTTQRSVARQFGTAASASSYAEDSISATLYAGPSSFDFNIVRWLDSLSGSWIPDNGDIAFAATYMTD